PSSDPDEQPFTGGKEVASALAQARTDAEARGIRLSLTTQGELCDVAISVGPLRYILTHVLGFAVERSACHGEIKVGVHAEADELVIDVAYEGASVVSDDLHVFEHGPHKLDEALLDLAVIRRVLTEVG